MEHIFGNIALAFGILMSLLGLPSQIWKNWREKKCDFNLLLIFLIMCTYVSRILYSYVKRQWPIIIPDSFGLFFSFILLYQYLYYRREKKNKQSKNYEKALAWTKTRAKGERMPPGEEGFPPLQGETRYNLILRDGMITQGKVVLVRKSLMWKTIHTPYYESAVIGWQYTNDPPTFW